MECNKALRSGFFSKEEVFRASGGCGGGGGMLLFIILYQRNKTETKLECGALIRNVYYNIGVCF
jgi:hypothetical protein